MSAAFQLATPDQVLFGSGRVAEVPSLVDGLGTRALVCTGASPARHEDLVQALRAAGIASVVHTVTGEPTVEDARRAVAAGEEHAADVVVGIGGGSVLDLAKAAAMLVANGGDPLDYIEVIGKGRPIIKRSVPLVLVPTTSGTGSEVTSNAVLGSGEHRVKVSLRSPLMLAHRAVVDPLLTIGVPPATTAFSGMDALTQCLEPYVSRHANPLSDAFAREGLGYAVTALPAAFEDGGDIQAREGMATASLFGGLALSNAKLGAVHGIAGPFGGMFTSPHGAVCAALLAPVMTANINALDDGDGLARYREVARILTGNPDAEPADGVEWVARLTERLGVPGLREYGFGEADIDGLSARAERSSSMKGNPVTLTAEELASVLRAAR